MNLNKQYGVDTQKNHLSMFRLIDKKYEACVGFIFFAQVSYEIQVKFHFGYMVVLSPFQLGGNLEWATRSPTHFWFVQPYIMVSTICWNKITKTENVFCIT